MLQSMGLRRVRHNLVMEQHFSEQVGSDWKQVNGSAGKRQNQPQDEPHGPVGLA